MTIKGKWLSRITWAAAIGALTALQAALSAPDGELHWKALALALLAAAGGGAARAMQDGHPWDDDSKPL